MAYEGKHNNKHSIKILGEELTIVGDISDAYAQKIADFINNIGKDISRAYPRLSRNRILGLAIVNITAELFKAEKRYQAQIKEISKLEDENILLREKMKKLQEEYEELLALLEEVD